MHYGKSGMTTCIRRRQLVEQRKKESEEGFLFIQSFGRDNFPRGQIPFQLTLGGIAKEAHEISHQMDKTGR